MAVLDANAAGDVLKEFTEIKTWYMAGHSLGGAMASDFAAKHPDEIAGVILLGAYRYGEIDPDKALTIYGTEDTVLDKTKIDYTEHVFVIEGGNHAQFGNYGSQDGDGAARITPEEQQKQTTKLILEFIAH